MPPEQRDANLLDIILELIDNLNRRLGDIFKEDFLDDKDEVDLAAFRLAAIGETSNKLSASLKGRHPHIDWANAYRMRNIIAHDYDAINAEVVWDTATHNLQSLKAACEAELKSIDG